MRATLWKLFIFKGIDPRVLSRKIRAIHPGMERIAGLALLTALFIAGCTQQDVCVDVFPNATVTDVLHDESAQRLYVSVLHRLSYCTGSDEKKYSVELIEVDLATGDVQIQQRASNSRAPYDVPDTCCWLFRDGNFTGGEGCPGCQLRLYSRDGAYEFLFESDVDWNLPMTLRVSHASTQLAVVDMGGYQSALRE